MLAKIVNIITGHRFAKADTPYYYCTCGEATFGRYRKAAQDDHDKHVAQMFIAAGLRLQPKDPREAFRARVETAGTE